MEIILLIIQVIAVTLITIGILSVIAAGFWLFILACQESLICALLYLFLPLYGFWFMFNRLDASWNNTAIPTKMFFGAISAVIVGTIILNIG